MVTGAAWRNEQGFCLLSALTMDCVHHISSCWIYISKTEIVTASCCVALSYYRSKVFVPDVFFNYYYFFFWKKRSRDGCGTECACFLCLVFLCVFGGLWEEENSEERGNDFNLTICQFTAGEGGERERQMQPGLATLSREREKGGRRSLKTNARRRNIITDSKSCVGDFHHPRLLLYFAMVTRTLRSKGKRNNVLR